MTFLVGELEPTGHNANALAADLKMSVEQLQPLYMHPLANPNSPRVFPAVRTVKRPLRILVTGGAGFVGSHLVDRLMLLGHHVTVLDNFFTGRRQNVEHWLGHPHFELVRGDVTEPFMMECDRIYHLACPASPPHYQHNPIKTIKTGYQGTLHMLGLAKRVGARFLLASTSEIYGDPQIHPQPEDYWGHVNPIGPRACYDEGKRIGETLAVAYAAQHHVQIRIARIFNTYGPRMNEADGRVVSNFLMAAIRREPLVVYGSGLQTRSFQYIHDLVDGLVALMESDYAAPVNIGNPREHSILEFARIAREVAGVAHDEKCPIVHGPEVKDDPQLRRPVVERAAQVLGWRPRISLEQGLAETLAYFQVTQPRNENTAASPE